MSEENGSTYFAVRAETERTLASESASPQVAAVHIAMAELYEALESGALALSPTPSTVSG